MQSRFFKVCLHYPASIQQVTNPSTDWTQICFTAFVGSTLFCNYPALVYLVHAIINTLYKDTHKHINIPLKFFHRSFQFHFFIKDFRLYFKPRYFFNARHIAGIFKRFYFCFTCLKKIVHYPIICNGITK